MGDLTRLAIHQATTERQWDLPQAIAGYARHGVQAITIRRDKLAACGMAEAKRRLDAQAMTVVGLSRAHVPTTPPGVARATSLDDYRRAIDEAAELGARYLITLADGLFEGSKDLPGARARAEEALAELLPEARTAGVRLGLEPLHPMNADFSCINRLDQATALASRLGDGIGVVIDTYHVWWDPELAGAIERAAGRIQAVHLNDWRVPTRDVMFDRAMPGDGAIDLGRFCRQIEAAGFTGHHEIEIFSSADWWQRDPDQVVATCVARYQALG